MGVSAKLWSSFLVITLQVAALRAEPFSIRIENQKDYEVLDSFFRMGIEEEEYGFVLEGAKPISVRHFYALDHFPISKDFKHAETEFEKTRLVLEASSVWHKLCPKQNNFVLKVISSNESGSTTPRYEVQFINIATLTEAIGKNIDLFRYVLGPSIDAVQLVKKIAYSDERLEEILHNDRVLEGIVLGFGSHNSVVGGRIEKIQALSISKDRAPFVPKSVLMQGERDHALNFLSPEMFGTYYLEFAGGDDTAFRDDSPLLPSPGFVNLEEELLVLDNMAESIPTSLTEKPAFVFGAFKKGSSNQPFFDRLRQVQKQTKVLLKKPHILESVLEKIGGKKPLIKCNKTICCRSLSSVLQSDASAEDWTRILRGVVDRLGDKESRSAFIEAFSEPSASDKLAPKMMGVSNTTLTGLRKALRNLSLANSHFDSLSEDRSLQEIVPKQLYFKTTFSVFGKELNGETRVRIGYIIEDPEGNILFANHDAWLDLSQTIPGFAHGVKGMHVNEKRTLFVHPTLAYGACTTLPPCIELIIKVHLIDIDEKSSTSLSSLTPIDLTWLQNPIFHQVLADSIQQQPRFTGSFYRALLDKVPQIDMEAIIASLLSSLN